MERTKSRQRNTRTVTTIWYRTGIKDLDYRELKKLYRTTRKLMRTYGAIYFTKWSNTLKQFVGNLPTNCLSVFDHFVGLALKGLRAT